MAIPTVYSEQALVEYMHQVLGQMAGRLAWSPGEHSYDEIVNDALIVYGTADISTVTGAANVEKLRAVARFVVWRWATDGLAAMYDFATDGQRFDRSQMHKAAMAARDKAQDDLIAAGVGQYAPVSTRVVYIHDPYSTMNDEDRVWP